MNIKKNYHLNLQKIRGGQPQLSYRERMNARYLALIEQLGFLASVGCLLSFRDVQKITQYASGFIGKKS